MKIVIATSNSGKLIEIKQLLRHLPVDVVSLPKGFIQTNEPYDTFVENALKKARHTSKKMNLPTLSDDSGLVVPALGGAPGVHSSRFSGKSRDEQKNIEKLVSLVSQLPKSKRKAFYVCVLVFVRTANDPAPIVASGTLHGEIVLNKIGESGFGYDPVFYLPEYKKTVAELSSAKKNKISHRAQASKLFISELSKLLI
ncbi:MAG: RdgB/HAM1 family non-canonical purine NTP pyrophosphatase [Methylacidiphilales bacterium]|nr:RdgB/HAM1 family non-canonical purine NTP pyrophosphatase [Candidatus Methylacidiphilales bacterium]